MRRKEKRVREVKNTLVKLFSLQVRRTGILPGVRPHWTSKGSPRSFIGGEISYHRVFCSLVVLLSATRRRKQLHRPQWQRLWRDSLHLWNNYLKLFETVKRSSRLTLKKVHLKTISFNPFVDTELILHLKYDFLLTPFTLPVGLTSLLTLIGQRINKSYKTLRVDVHLSASSLILAIVWSQVMQFVFMQIL